MTDSLLVPMQHQSPLAILPVLGLALSVSLIALVILLLTIQRLRTYTQTILLNLWRLCSRLVQRGVRAREAWRYIGVTSLVAGAAWVVAAWAGMKNPALAAVGATLTVQLSAHISLKNGVRRLAATGLGLCLALIAYHVLGKGVFSVVCVVAASLVIGRLLGLGEDGERTLPATSLLMFFLGGALTGVLAWQDMAATFIGAVFGVSGSLVAHHQSPIERAEECLRDLSASLASLLGDVASGSVGAYTLDDAQVWLMRARESEGAIGEATARVDEAVEYSKWALSERNRDVDGLLSSLQVLSHSVGQVAAIARAVYDAKTDDSAISLTEDVAQVVGALGEAFDALADDIDEGPRSLNADTILDPLQELHAEAKSELRSIDDTGVLYLTSAILADAGRMEEQLRGEAAALDF